MSIPETTFFQQCDVQQRPALPQTVYFRFGTTTATNLASTANNNLLYAGTPAVDHLIYVDGAVNALTNPQQTLGDYQAFVAPRENASITGDPGFVSTTGSDPTFLHITNASPAFHTGVPVLGITDDYDGDVRNPCTPDIGGDEVMSYGGPASLPSASPDRRCCERELGNQAGFKVKLTNTSANPALGADGYGQSACRDRRKLDDRCVRMTDPGWSVSGAPPTQSLVYTPTTLAGSAMTMAHVISATTVATCGSTLSNTASFSITNGCAGIE